MKKQFVIKSLQRLEQYQEKYRVLKEAGIDVMEFQRGIIDLLEESICAVLCNGDEKLNENIQGDVLWWLYEDVEKVIVVKKRAYNVESPEDFVNWLFKHYKL